LFDKSLFVKNASADDCLAIKMTTDEMSRLQSSREVHARRAAITIATKCEVFAIQHTGGLLVQSAMACSVDSAAAVLVMLVAVHGAPPCTKSGHLSVACSTTEGFLYQNKDSRSALQ